MVPLSSIQGVVNTFVMVLSRVIGHTIDRVIIRKGHGPADFVTLIASGLVPGVLASIVVMWFSRRRELGADCGSASLASWRPSPLPDRMAAFGIAGGVPVGWRWLFMSHPPIEERIAALGLIAREAT